MEYRPTWLKGETILGSSAQGLNASWVRGAL